MIYKPYSNASNQIVGFCAFFAKHNGTFYFSSKIQNYMERFCIKKIIWEFACPITYIVKILDILSIRYKI